MSQLPLIIEQGMLPEDTWSKLSDMATELAAAYSNRQIFRTETEARISVLDDLHYPTKASKYWQALREQTVMLEQLATLSFDYRRNETKIKRLQRQLDQLNEYTSDFDCEDTQTDLDECLFKRANMRTVAADRAREIQMWSMLKGELDDGSFDTTNVDTHQLVSYTSRFALRAANANTATMSSGEMDNLSGQWHTALKRCREKGVLDQVLCNLPVQVAQQIPLKN